MSYQLRLHKLQQLFSDFKCDALLVEDAINLYYMTGLQLSAGALLVHSAGANLIVDGRYFELCNKMSPFPVMLNDPTRNAWTDLFTRENPPIKLLAFDTATTSFRRYLELQVLTQVHQLTLVPIDSPFKYLRSIKDENEITLMRSAAALGSLGFDYLCTLLKEGITETELAAKLEIFWKQSGSKGLAFDPIIAFGPNSAMPHYRAGNASLKKGDCVLIDIGVNRQHYHSDMTRVVFFGTPDPTLHHIYNIVQKAHKAALALCRPGTLIGALDQSARGIISAEGYGEQFTHSLGHGVGLEIHEYPTLRNIAPFKDVPLQAGMVITIEPGIYLPGLGGVRIEDAVLITPSGHENLTNRSTKLTVF